MDLGTVRVGAGAVMLQGVTRLEDLGRHGVIRCCLGEGRLVQLLWPVGGLVSEK